MIIYRILIITLLITVSYSTLIYALYNEKEEQVPEEKKEAPEERKNYYLQLKNMTTHEILLFKDKKEFINTIKQYDSIKYFLKGTEEENINQLISWYYPGFKKL